MPCLRRRRHRGRTDGTTWTIAQVAERVRGHPPHGAALRGPGPDLPRAARHDARLPPPRPHPARPHPARQAARLPAGGDPHDHRPLRRPRGEAGQLSTCWARSTSGGPTWSAAAGTSRTPSPSWASSSAGAGPTCGRVAQPFRLAVGGGCAGDPPLRVPACRSRRARRTARGRTSGRARGAGRRRRSTRRCRSWSRWCVRPS